MSWPKRTGLVTAHRYAKLLKTILQKFRDTVLVNILDPAELAKVDALIECCNVFITDVPQYEPPS